MLIHATVMEEDYKQYLKYVYKHLNQRGSISKKEQIGIGIFLIMVFVALEKIISFPISDLHIPTLLTISMPLILFLILFIYFIVKFQRNSMPKKDGIILGDKNLNLTDDGIEETSKYGRLFCKWCAVESVCEDKGNVYIFLDTTVAIILPESTFTNPDDRMIFIKFIMDKLKEKIINA